MHFRRYRFIVHQKTRYARRKTGSGYVLFPVLFPIVGAHCYSNRCSRSAIRANTFIRSDGFTYCL